LEKVAPPPGFSPHFRQSPLTDPWEPLFSRVDSDGVAIGVWITRAHCNARDLAHGGLITALADNAMGLSCGQILKARSPDAAKGGLVTVSLSIDFIASAKTGQWLEIAPRVLRAGRTTCFVDALVTANGTLIARASATFRVV
jgi:acyl-coenzyme A thioesterase PaaI-like protein